MFTPWVYDELTMSCLELKVANPLLLDFISKGKKKSDKIDAEKLADLLRCDLIPEVYVPDAETRHLRTLLRHRNFIVRQITRFKNKTTSLLMAHGISYAKTRVHGKRYFDELLRKSEIPESVLLMLRINRNQINFLKDIEHGLSKRILKNERLCERATRLISIPGVGIITALTWCVEIGDAERFSSSNTAISYCGLCSRQKESAGKSVSTPLSKQRNKHLQWILVEAAKIAARRNEKLATLYHKVTTVKNANAATIAVARKLVKYLLALDKSGGIYHEAYEQKINNVVP